MTRYKKILLSFVLAIGVAAPVISAEQVGAVNVWGTCDENSTSEICRAQSDASANTFISNLVNVLLFFLGAVAVIMIIVGGFKYVTANGDSNAITSAKNTILYSAIGVAVAVAAYAIVNYVIGQF